MFLPLDHAAALSEDDVAKLLDYIGGIDGQDHGSEADLSLWLMAAQAGRWTRAETIAGVLTLMREFHGFLIKTADMQAAVEAARTAVKNGWDPPPPPRELADDPLAEIEWRRAALADYRERAILALAQGEPLESVPVIAAEHRERVELTAVPNAEYVAAVERWRKAVEARSARTLRLTKREWRDYRNERPPARTPRKSELHPDEARKALTELAERAPVPLPEGWEATGA